MLEEKKLTIAFIPARGGSKGIPKKNIKPLGGIPLISHTIREALKCAEIDRVIVSTDSDEIAAVAVESGAEVPFLRPAHLATDQSPGIDPVLHCLEQMKAVEVLVLLQPTSPFRTSEHIRESLALFQKTQSSVVSVSEANKHPAWMYTVDQTMTMQRLMDIDFWRRQDLPKIYCPNGAIYIASREQLVNEKSFLISTTKAYSMSRMHSLDIDTLEDWEYAEYLIARNTI